MRLRTSLSAAHPSAPSLRLPTAIVAILAAVALALGVPAGAHAQSDPVAGGARAVDSDAGLLVEDAQAVAASAAGKVDTTDLGVQIAQLDDAGHMSEITVAALTGQLRATVANVTAAVAAYDAAQAAAAAAAEALAAANAPDAARANARQQAADRYGWGDSQFSCLDALWQRESGWEFEAANGSGAYGIPQALPGSKMASAGDDWETVAATQIAWGLAYIANGYGTPCAAWSQSESAGWY